MSTKQQKIGTCKLCKEEDKLTKAHLFSKCLLEFLTQPIKCTIQNVEKTFILSEGWFDYILCANCNNKTIAEHEKILKAYLALYRTPYDLQLQDNITKFLEKKNLTSDQLYTHLKLAILSFFWQFQVAEATLANDKIEFFDFKLSDEDLEQIRQMILHNNPGELAEYSVNIAYNIPRGRFETLTQKESSYTSNEIRFDIFAIKLIFLNRKCFDSGNRLNTLSPNNIDQPLDDSAFSLGDMRNALLDKRHAPFIQNLFERAKSDGRPLEQTPSHPIRILKNLITISPLRSQEHYKTVANVMLNNLNIQNEFSDKYTPLNVLKEFMSLNFWEIEDQHDSNTRLQHRCNKDEDLSLKNSEYWQLRKDIIKSIITVLDLKFPIKCYTIIEFVMFKCINYVESNQADPEVEQLVNKEAIDILTELKTLIHEKKLSIPSLAIVAIKISNIEYDSPKNGEIKNMLIEINKHIHLQINNLGKKVMFFFLTQGYHSWLINPSIDNAEAKTLEWTKLKAEVASKYPDIVERKEFFNAITCSIKKSIPNFPNRYLNSWS